MVKLFFSIFFMCSVLQADFQSSISPITNTIKQRMLQGNSYKNGCPVSLKDLRYLQIKYKNFNDENAIGELIVHKSVAKEVVKIFKELYRIGYPIKKMKLVSDYKGNDWQSIEADNTSAFNCRNATGSKKWSKHSYGKAIDINPIENPYISKSGSISHKASLQYRNRDHRLDVYPDNWAILLKDDHATQIFKKYGWKWGGDWHGVKDYQHFSK